MSSTKTTPISRAAITPQRSNGKARVATLLESAAAVIAEKGYDDATMAEIAARAKAPIGSLYRFFPNKEILADALIDRYAVLLNQTFDRLEQDLANRSLDSLADAILDFKINLRAETKIVLSFLSGRSNWSVRRVEFRNLALKRLAKVLLLRAPSLTKSAAGDVAVILLHNMKTMAALKFDKNVLTSPGAAAELRHMNRLYLANRLTPDSPRNGRRP